MIATQDPSTKVYPESQTTASSTATVSSTYYSAGVSTTSDSTVSVMVTSPVDSSTSVSIQVLSTRS